MSVLDPHLRRVLMTYFEPFAARDIGVRFLRAAVVGEVKGVTPDDALGLYAEAEQVAEELLGTSDFWTFEEGTWLRFLPLEFCDVDDVDERVQDAVRCRELAGTV